MGILMYTHCTCGGGRDDGHVGLMLSASPSVPPPILALSSQPFLLPHRAECVPGGPWHCCRQSQPPGWHWLLLGPGRLWLCGPAASDVHVTDVSACRTWSHAFPPSLSPTQCTLGMLLAETVRSAGLPPLLWRSARVWNPIVAFDVFGTQVRGHGGDVHWSTWLGRNGSGRGVGREALRGSGQRCL